jgi:alpha-L-fucosidase
MPAPAARDDDIRPGYEQRDGARDDRRLDWWREARFGLFIHWGLYAQDPARWADMPDTVIHHWTGEWIQHVKRIPRDRYVTWAETFDPVGFDADRWVDLARRAGQKYIVLTAKHHDGFCLFATETTEFNIVQATPFGRDVVAELAAACDRAGMPFGVYYSQAQDWHDPDGLGNEWDDDPAEKDFDRYLEGRCKPQLRELLTGYGRIAIVWFDTPMTMTPDQSGQLVDLVGEHQPDCLVCGRIGNSLGDYTSFRDNRFAAGVADFDFETPMTMNRTWGYVAADTGFTTGNELLWTLIDTASKGGNLLCNVGPDELGLFPDGNRRPLLRVGSWLADNGRAIYATRPAEISQPGRLRFTRNDAHLFCHVITWPIDGVVALPEQPAGVSKATILADGTRLEVESSSGRRLVRLPACYLSQLPVVLELPAGQ